MTKIFYSISEWREYRSQEFFVNKSIGLVTTMGNLHHGHQSLFDKSVKENEITVASIFVNPTQFDNADDLENYPRTFEQDVHLAAECGVDFILAPQYHDLYPDDYRYRIVENDFSKQLCGEFRSGHFDGVLTIVLKLFNLIKPHRAYFGEKDFQQLKLITDMVEAFFMDINIVPCEIIRDENGIALSSRNNRLSAEQYQLLKHFPLLLRSNLSPSDLVKKLISKGFEVDYIKEISGRRFGAVKLGGIRLIDNIRIDECIA